MEEATATTNLHNPADAPCNLKETPHFSSPPTKIPRTATIPTSAIFIFPLPCPPEPDDLPTEDGHQSKSAENTCNSTQSNCDTDETYLKDKTPTEISQSLSEKPCVEQPITDVGSAMPSNPLLESVISSLTAEPATTQISNDDTSAEISAKTPNDHGASGGGPGVVGDHPAMCAAPPPKPPRISSRNITRDRASTLGSGSAGTIVRNCSLSSSSATATSITTTRPATTPHPIPPLAIQRMLSEPAGSTTSTHIIYPSSPVEATTTACTNKDAKTNNFMCSDSKPESNSLEKPTILRKKSYSISATLRMPSIRKKPFAAPSLPPPTIPTSTPIAARSAESLTDKDRFASSAMGVEGESTESLNSTDSGTLARKKSWSEMAKYKLTRRLSQSMGNNHGIKPQQQQAENQLRKDEITQNGEGSTLKFDGEKSEEKKEKVKEMGDHDGAGSVTSEDEGVKFKQEGGPTRKKSWSLSLRHGVRLSVGAHAAPQTPLSPLTKPKVMISEPGEAQGITRERGGSVKEKEYPNVSKGDRGDKGDEGVSGSKSEGAGRKDLWGTLSRIKRQTWSSPNSAA